MEPADNVEIEITDYQVTNPSDPSNSENHTFDIRIWLTQNYYDIKRTYANFCEFDYQLNKKYSKSSLPICPLSSSISAIHAAATSAANPNLLPLTSSNSNISSSTPSSTSSTSTTSITSSTRNHLIKNPLQTKKGYYHINSSTENISSKLKLLQKYLEELLEIPEILHSIELLTFLDIESNNGFHIPNEKMEVIEYLLNQSKDIHVTVMKEFQIRLAVQETQFVIWRFSTKNKDIGFDVLMETGGGIVLNTSAGSTNTITTISLIPYQRYKSHESVVEDVLEIQSSGFILLHWDNTYSKMLSKHLSYIFRVVDSQVYQEATQICLDFTRKKLECESKRNLLRRIMATKANSILASSGIRASMYASSVMDYKSSIRYTHQPILSLVLLSHGVVGEVEVIKCYLMKCKMKSNS